MYHQRTFLFGRNRTLLLGANTQEQRELVRKQLVERYSCKPLWIARAKASGNEAEYWSKFSVGGRVHPIQTVSTQCSLPVIERLTNSELEHLRQAQNEAFAYGQKMYPNLRILQR